MILKLVNNVQMSAKDEVLFPGELTDGIKKQSQGLKEARGWE